MNLAPSLSFFMSNYFIKPQWLFSLGTDFKWLAFRLGLGILCVITDSTFLSQSFLEGHCSLMNLLTRTGGNLNYLLRNKELKHT